MIDRKDRAFDGDQGIVGGDVEMASGVLLGSLHDDLAVIEVNRGAFPRARNGDSGALAHFNQGAVLKLEHCSRSLGGANRGAVTDLISGEKIREIVLVLAHSVPRSIHLVANLVRFGRIQFAFGNEFVQLP